MPDWSPRPLPGLPSKPGRTVSIERFDAATHGAALFEAIDRPAYHDLWEFIPMGPFDDAESFTAFFSAMHASGAWHVYVFRRPADGARGVRGLARRGELRRDG